MGIEATSGSGVAIGPINDTAETSAAYAALTYTEVGDVESIGEFGDTAATISFTSLTAARVRKRKGVRDAGDMSLVVADNPEDEGQEALIEAEAGEDSYAIRVTTRNRVVYFRALVATARQGAQEANNILKRNYNLLIDSKIIPAS